MNFNNKLNGGNRKANNRVGEKLNLYIMKKNEEFKIEQLEIRLEMANCYWNTAGYCAPQ